MLHVTPHARTELHGLLIRVLAEREDPGPVELGLRLISQAGRLGLTLDAPRKNDEVVEQAGRSVLIVDPSTSEMLDELTLDVVETTDGARFALLE